MPKASGQKLKLIAVLDILREHSDEEHPVTATEICELLAQKGITIRETVW